MTNTDTTARPTYVPTRQQATALLGFGSISDRQFHILVMRYGWFGTPPRTLDETAWAAGMDRMEVRKLEAWAMAELRSAFGPKS